MTRPFRTQRSLDLDQVFSETMDTVERAKEEIFFIAEEARSEVDETRAELDRIRREAQVQIQRVDVLQREDREVRLRLLRVSRNFAQHPEDEIRSVYDRAREVQTRLQVALERERGLRKLRDALEQRLRRLQKTLQRAESLVSQVDLALRVLTGNLQQLTAEVEGVRSRQALGVTIVRAQEEERRRLARDIHDGPAQLLANVAFRIDMCERLLNEDVGRVRLELGRLKGLVRQSLQDVRKIILDLRPMAIDDLGLIPALRGLIAELTERFGLFCRLEVEGPESRLDQAIEIAAFRFIQEALNNVWKHAGTGEADIAVTFRPEWVAVEVRDRGRGFDPESILGRPSGDHFGLVNMRERVHLLQGSFDLRTAPGEGTTLRVVLPRSRESDREGEEEAVVGNPGSRSG